MLQKVAEIVYEKVQDRTVTSKELAEKIANLPYDGASFEVNINESKFIEVAAKIISEYGRKGSGLEDAATKIVNLLDPKQPVYSEITDENRPELLPDSTDEHYYVTNTFEEPEHVFRLLKYLREEKKEIVSVIDLEEIDDGPGYQITVKKPNGDTDVYVMTSVDDAFDRAIDIKAERISMNVYDYARDAVENGCQGYCDYFGYSDEYETDDGIIIFQE